MAETFLTDRHMGDTGSGARSAFGIVRGKQRGDRVNI